MEPLTLQMQLPRSTADLAYQRAADTVAAAERRDAGMQRADDNAAADNEFWREQAERAIERFARNNAEFLAEDVIEFSRGMVPEPPDGRAWGAVFKRAARRGFIHKIGFAHARTSNLSPKVLWAAGPSPLAAAS